MKRYGHVCLALLAGLCLLASRPATAEDAFSTKVGAVKVGDVKPSKAYDVPYLLWGGDVATFIANGGNKETKKDTLFAKQGLQVNLVPGDDFVGQVKSYLEGKTPFLRGTMSQFGQASEVLGQDPRTQPVVFLQMTWSAGDWLVGRPTCKTLNDLKGKKVALQWGGPHVGMFDDVLRSVSLKWSDVKVVWTEDVTGAKGPAEAFRKDASVDACFVVTPDMQGLTGGADKVGTGAEGTVKGAKVLVSTQSLSHSIADVYACRKDYFDKNEDTIKKFTAAYLKACEQLVEMRKNYDAKEKDKDLLAKYKQVLKMTRDIYGKDVPDDDAAHGLISDATFVGLPGNYTFFKGPETPINFASRARAAVDMAINQGYAKKRNELLAANFDYDKLKETGDLKTEVKATRKPLFPEDLKIDPDKDTIFSYTILFDPDETRFDKKKYEEGLKKAITEAAIYGNALIRVRGHVDPTVTLRLFVKAALEKKIITRERVGDGYKYYTAKGGKQFELSDTKKVLELINSSDFSGVEESPKAMVKEAQKLSDARAKQVRDAILALAKANKLVLDNSQIRSEGAGIKEPIITVPRNEEQAAKNRRVEFRIERVSPEKLSKKDFDF